MQKALLYALLVDYEKLGKLQDDFDFTALMVKQEEYKTLPFGAVWKEYLNRTGVEEDYLVKIRQYESRILKERV